MEQFLYRLHPVRVAMLADGPTEQEAQVIAAHFAYLQNLVEEGKVLMAGRTLTQDEESCGIVVLEVDSESSAREVSDNDPAVKNHVMRADLFPYRVALWSKTGPSQ